MVKTYSSLVSRMNRLSAFAAIAVVLLIAVSVWAGLTRTDNAGSQSAPEIRTFVWYSDATHGIGVTYRLSDLCGTRRLPKDIKIRLTEAGTLGEYWEIREVNAYFRAGDRRRLVVGEGPFPVEPEKVNSGSTCRTWSMRSLKDREYEIDFCLHKLKDGMSPEEVRTSIREQDAFTLRVERLTGPGIHVCVRP